MRLQGRVNMSLYLPIEIKDVLKDHKVEPFSYYTAKAKVYKATGDGERLFLKIQENGSLIQEYSILKWIDGRISTPRPIKYVKEGATEYLVTSQVQGTPVYLIPDDDRELHVKLMAQTLQEIHAILGEGCPYVMSSDIRLELARKLNPNKMKEIDKLARALKPLEEKLVFTHGDYCLPNILVHEGDLGGVIDWDCGGLAHPYVDFVMCSWSLSYNYGAEEAREIWFPLFLEEYGVTIDREIFRLYEEIENLFD